MRHKSNSDGRRRGRWVTATLGTAMMLSGILWSASAESQDARPKQGADSRAREQLASAQSMMRQVGQGSRPATIEQDLLSQGEQLYARNCAICHGDSGDGAGAFGFLLNPRARDLRRGDFKFAMTENQIPTDEDLARTIRNGMPGSAMPPWEHLSDANIDALVAYVRHLHQEGVREMLTEWASKGTIAEEEIASLMASRTQPGPAIVPPPEPPFDESRWFRGRKLYLENCASCHGVDGEPVAEEVKYDAEGYPVPPRSFVQGIFKGGSEGDQLYVRLLKGMRGTPMPGSEGIYSSDEIWDVVHYVQSLARAGAQQRAQLKSGVIVAKKAEASLPADGDDPAWEKVQSYYVSLTPLWWAEQRIEGVLVQAMHDSTELAVRMQWIDSTQDDSAVGQGEFRDAASVQFSLSPDPPFFMGDAMLNGGVNFWMWKADRQRNIRDGYRDEDDVFPDRVVDRYPEAAYRFTDMSVVEWPRQPIAAHNPLFLTAWGAGNLVANPNLKTPVECLTAKGPGTLSGKPAPDQVVQGKGRYHRGVWTVQFQRSMSCPHGHGANDEVVFLPGTSIPISLAIWDGAAGDRAGKKNFSTWQTLVIE